MNDNKIEKELKVEQLIKLINLHCQGGVGRYADGYQTSFKTFKNQKASVIHRPKREHSGKIYQASYLLSFGKVDIGYYQPETGKIDLAEVLYKKGDAPTQAPASPVLEIGLASGHPSPWKPAALIHNLHAGDYVVLDNLEYEVTRVTHYPSENKVRALVKAC